MGSPYWNYEGPSNENTLPFIFRQQLLSGNPNPLYTALRAPGINNGAALPSTTTSDAVAIACASFIATTEFGGGITSPLGQFDTQTGQLEQQPHNVVHTHVGAREVNIQVRLRSVRFRRVA